MDQPLKVRDESQARVKKAILSLPFKKNNSGNYNCSDAQIFNKQVAREFERQHNKFTTNGMKGLTSRHQQQTARAQIQPRDQVVGRHQNIESISHSQKK